MQMEQSFETCSVVTALVLSADNALRHMKSLSCSRMTRHHSARSKLHSCAHSVGVHINLPLSRPTQVERGIKPKSNSPRGVKLGRTPLLSLAWTLASQVAPLGLLSQQSQSQSASEFPRSFDQANATLTCQVLVDVAGMGRQGRIQCGVVAVAVAVAMLLLVPRVVPQSLLLLPATPALPAAWWTVSACEQEVQHIMMTVPSGRRNGLLVSAAAAAASLRLQHAAHR
jgi:hypothetical protein